MVSRQLVQQWTLFKRFCSDYVRLYCPQLQWHLSVCYFTSGTVLVNSYLLIGVSMSKPHTDDVSGDFLSLSLYIYISTMVCTLFCKMLNFNKTWKSCTHAYAYLRRFFKYMCTCAMQCIMEKQLHCRAVWKRRGIVQHETQVSQWKLHRALKMEKRG